jgi:hypothetical protein
LDKQRSRVLSSGSNHVIQEKGVDRKTISEHMVKKRGDEKFWLEKEVTKKFQ